MLWKRLIPVVASVVALTAMPLNTSFAASKGCQLFGNLKSFDSGKRSTVRFKNRTNGFRSVMWLDYNGQPVTYKNLNAGESYTQQTFVGHPWMITDGPGNCKQIFIPRRARHNVNINVR